MVRSRGIDEAAQGSAPVGGLIRNVIYLPFERVNASLVRTSRGHAIGAVNQHAIHGAKGVGVGSGEGGGSCGGGGEVEDPLPQLDQRIVSMQTKPIRSTPRP